ncbi:MAG TPA: RraA family protein [bacterium]|nr:RraA family protein [bacterium]
MADPLPPDRLAELRLYSSPTIANAIETFNVRPRTAGFMSSQIRCIFPELGTMVGYAFTATIRASAPPPPAAAALRPASWRALEELPAPRIVVIQDLDDPPGVGAFWGDVQSNIHRALGCVGTVTNGSVRDLDEVRALGFHFFAGSVSVSHAYVHLVEIGGVVQVGGLTVRPGDLLHGDPHGIVSIPLEIAGRISEGVEKVDRVERQLINYCQAPGFSRQGFEELHRKLRG